MAITTVRNEKNLGELLGKRYPRLTPAELTRVLEATLKANPHLDGAGRLKPGAVVVLPELDDATPTTPRSNDGGAADGVAALLAEIATQVPMFLDNLERSRGDLDLSAKLLKSASFKRTLEGAPEAAVELAKGLEASLKTEREAVDEAVDLFRKDIDTIKVDLKSLLDKLA
ncbi:MAG: hypothetical protein ACSLE5_06975 [Porticoccaceae bacterium]